MFLTIKFFFELGRYPGSVVRSYPASLCLGLGTLATGQRSVSESTMMTARKAIMNCTRTVQEAKYRALFQRSTCMLQAKVAMLVQAHHHVTQVDLLGEQNTDQVPGIKQHRCHLGIL